MQSDSFKYIRNRIREYRKDDVLEYCYELLQTNHDKIFPVWYVFTLIKWTLVYGEHNYPPRALSRDKFGKLFNLVQDFNQDHITEFIKNKELKKAFQVLYNQQFYLQKSVYPEIFATQLKLISGISGRYNIEDSFKEKTGLTVLEFLKMEQLVWLYINIGQLNEPDLYFPGYLDKDFVKTASEVIEIAKVSSFLLLLTLNPYNTAEGISNFTHKIKKEDLQTMEMSFFTMFPFALHRGQMRLVHQSVFHHSANYYIYDFLKANDPQFTTEFGDRLEKYVECGLIEMQSNYLTEAKLKRDLPKGSNLVDFVVQDQNIFIECKATELQAHPSVNPTDELLYNALKSSIFKAYFKQMLSVCGERRNGGENWGVILTYKELYWSNFNDLFEIGKQRQETELDYDILPPENVFIIDVYTWDKIVQIVKDRKATLTDILKLAKSNNSSPETSKQLFNMHLDQFELKRLQLSYLTSEMKELNLEQRTTPNTSS